jgi:hypothetical protein
MTHSWRLSVPGVFLGLAALSTGCTTVPTCPPADIVQLPAPEVSASLPGTPHEMPLLPPSVPSATLALERKVKLQQKRIAELSSQLRLLKRIDLDRNKP